MILVAWIKKRLLRMEILWLFVNEKVLVAAFSKEGNANSVLREEKTHHYWYPRKRYNCEQYSKTIFHFTYWTIPVYLYCNLRSSLLRCGTRPIEWGHPMRLELTLAGLLVKLANHYTTRGVPLVYLYWCFTVWKINISSFCLF